MAATDDTSPPSRHARPMTAADGTGAGGATERPWQLVKGDLYDHGSDGHENGFTILMAGARLKHPDDDGEDRCRDRIGRTLVIHEIRYAEDIFPTDVEYAEAEANARLIVAAVNAHAAAHAGPYPGHTPEGEPKECDGIAWDRIPPVTRSHRNSAMTDRNAALERVAETARKAMKDTRWVGALAAALDAVPPETLHEPTQCPACPLAAGCYWGCLRSGDLEKLNELIAALREIAATFNKTLVMATGDPHERQAYSLGAHRAFSQVADIASAALAKAEGRDDGR